MKVTVEEIARVACVSKATVSRVLNNSSNGVGEQTRNRVLDVINKMNYSKDTWNGNLNAMKSLSIALIIPDITNPFFAEIAKAIEERAKECGFMVFLMNTDFSEDNEVKLISKIVAKKVDGIILVPSGKECRSEHFLPSKYGIPMVFLDRKLDGIGKCIGVFSDNELASFMSCEMLIKHGSKDIVFISGPSEVSTSIERLTGYKDALGQYNINYNQNLIKNGDYTVESGYNAIIQLERAGIKYSAVLATNDMMALGALKALKELDYRVPEDIEVIGFDNIQFSQYFEPPLTTIQQPTIEMGRKAADLLLNLIQENNEQSDILRLQPKILIRKTTKRRF